MALIIGALVVPHERVRPLTLKLRNTLSGLRWPRTNDGNLVEIKWTKVSPAGLRFYEALLDFFADEADLHFHALVAPKSPSPYKLPKPPPDVKKPGTPAWEKYQLLLEQTTFAVLEYQERQGRWYHDRFSDLLRSALDPQSKHIVYLDVKDTHGSDRMKELTTRLLKGQAPTTIEHIQQINSRESLLIQLVDVLLGCVAWTHIAPERNEGHHPSNAKTVLAQKIQNTFLRPNIAANPKFIVNVSSERSPQ